MEYEDGKWLERVEAKAGLALELLDKAGLVPAELKQQQQQTKQSQSEEPVQDGSAPDEEQQQQQQQQQPISTKAKKPARKKLSLPPLPPPPPPPRRSKAKVEPPVDMIDDDEFPEEADEDDDDDDNEGEYVDADEGPRGPAVPRSVEPYPPQFEPVDENEVEENGYESKRTFKKGSRPGTKGKSGRAFEER